MRVCIYTTYAVAVVDKYMHGKQCTVINMKSLYKSIAVIFLIDRSQGSESDHKCRTVLMNNDERRVLWFKGTYCWSILSTFKCCPCPRRSCGYSMIQQVQWVFGWMLWTKAAQSLRADTHNSKSRWLEQSTWLLRDSVEAEKSSWRERERVRHRSVLVGMHFLSWPVTLYIRRAETVASQMWPASSLAIASLSSSVLHSSMASWSNCMMLRQSNESRNSLWKLFDSCSSLLINLKELW